MQTAPIPGNEQERIAALHFLSLLDTEPEERFDRLTRMARRLFSVSIAAVTLVDSDRQWFKSKMGLVPPETPRDVSFCGHAVMNDEILLVPDALRDQRFVDNPLVTGAPKIRFYAGCPLNVGGYNVGTLCVIDEKPREFSKEEMQLLKDLAKLAEDELTAVQQATTDHLTGISNRRGFETLAEHALAVSKRQGRPLTLLYFDLNHFKNLNDTQGHAAGDQALKIFAQGLLTVFRASDVIGRLGGDEFAVLLTGSAEGTAAQTLGRLKDWLKANSADAKSVVEFSVGETAFEPERHSSLAVLMAEADAAMYKQKEAGRRADRFA